MEYTDDILESFLPNIDTARHESDSPPHNIDTNANADVDKPYHSKRPHKKSRAGCTNCKKRKVKCNEERPTCHACTLRKEACVYPSAPNKKAPSQPPPSSVVSTSSARYSSTSATEDDPFQTVLSEPLYRPAQMADALDMRMLWFWTAETYGSFSIESGRSAIIDQVLKFRVVEHAFRSPFLMDCLMGLSALQMQGLKQDISPQRVLTYRARAFAGYRKAIEAANPDDFPALLACSLLMTALSSQVFREDDLKPLYIIEWMQVWKGIGLIVEIISPQSIQDSGLAVIFYRPPVDIEKSSRHIPNNLLFMVTSITAEDADYEHQHIYYETLQYLGSLYMELNHGFGPMLDLRTVTWFTFVPRDFTPLAKMHHPRALIILAYYCCFAKLNRSVWWMQGIANPEIDHICKIMGDEWEHLLRIPQKVRLAEEKLDIAKIITENHNWTPEEEDLYQRHIEGSVKYNLVTTLPVSQPVTIEPSPFASDPRVSDPLTSDPLIYSHGDMIAQGLLLDKLMQVDPSINADSPPKITVVHDRTDSPRPAASPAAQSSLSSASPSSSTAATESSSQSESYYGLKWRLISELSQSFFTDEPPTDSCGRII